MFSLMRHKQEHDVRFNEGNPFFPCFFLPAHNSEGCYASSHFCATAGLEYELRVLS